MMLRVSIQKSLACAKSGSISGMTKAFHRVRSGLNQLLNTSSSAPLFCISSPRCLSNANTVGEAGVTPRAFHGAWETVEFQQLVRNGIA
jgi:hypothetical protein